MPRTQLLFLQCIFTVSLNQSFVIPQSRRTLQMDHAAVHIWLKGVSAPIFSQVSQQALVTEAQGRINTDGC